MTIRRQALAALLIAVLTGVAPAASAQSIAQRPDVLTLGRNAQGEPCTATRNWRDPAVTDPFDQSWSINCRNVAAARAVGSIRIVGAAAANRRIEQALTCGEVRRTTVAGIGPVEARRCLDAGLGTYTVAYRFRDRSRTVLVSAAPAVLGPAEEGARIVTGRQRASADAGRATTNSIDLAALAAGPSVGANAGGAFDASIALADGSKLIRRGLHVEASRILNDALSRLPADGAPAVRAEVLLEAGLADSNIRFIASAAEHFAEADRLIAGVPGDRGQFLTRKRDAYRALDLLNQRRFREALVSLERLTTRPAPVGQPLEDAAVVRLLNQTRRNDAASSVSVPDTATLEPLVLDAQANWARSVALLALGDAAASSAALDRAKAAYLPLLRDRIDPTLVLWLGAQIDRQDGRLAARRKDFPRAIALFDQALGELRRTALGSAGTGTEPAIAELQLERAGIIADQGGDPARVRREYDAAIDALILANQTGGGNMPASVDRYFDLLVAEAKDAPRADTYDRFFRAMQAVGEPAVARQLTQLQSIVSADPSVGVKVRDRAEVERTITRLRYAIAAGEGGAGAAADLERQRSEAEARLLALDAELAASPRFSSINDTPASVTEVRAALAPNEAFLKLVQLPRKSYGIVVTADTAEIYPVAASNGVLQQLADRVRASIDGQLDKGVLVPFDADSAYALFRLVTGPTTDTLLAGKALVIDPAGPLQTFPAGVLVTDAASLAARRAIARERPFDYSGVGFLARKLTLSTAVSPRSFLVARALKPSAAPRPFLGIGEHQPAIVDADPATATRPIRVGFGCQVDYATLAGLSRQLPPISRRELDLAGQALAIGQPPEITGAAFTDSAIKERRDLGSYEVLHFATHGLKEGVWGCPKSPPALVTSFGDAGSDGLLSFSEIAQLRLDANLVVLSACDTASGIKDEALARQSGQEESGANLEGLVRAFLTANSRAVLATFWQVSAEAETEQFIRTFYGNARRRDIGGALQAAQTALMDDARYSHPFYWGPYFVVGDATKMMLSGVAAVQPGGQVAAR